jgi:hypothetical protein
MRASLFAIGLLVAVPAFPQHSNHAYSQNIYSHREVREGHSPYAGMQTRTIKALSEQHFSNLRGGKGISLALAAELNGYPGPLDVIEMAKVLGLSQGQLLQTKRLYKEMQTEAKAMGKEFISSEAELDRLFKGKKASLAVVQDATARAAQVQGQLRAAILNIILRWWRY